MFFQLSINLSSVPQLCDTGCECQFDKINVTITCNDQTINGARDPITNL